MITDIKMRISADPRGKISCGKKSDSGLPQSLDYFNVEKFNELLHAYGNKPKSLVVFFPSDRITDFFDCNYILYKRNDNDEGIEIRRCNSQQCFHRMKEDIDGKIYPAGTESPCVCKALPETVKKNGKDIPNPKKCRYSMWLKCFIALPQTGKIENPLCYMFAATSKNSGDNIYSELEKTLVLTGGKIIGIPFLISVTMHSGKEDIKKKFPIMSLKPIGMISQMRKIASMEVDPALLVETPHTAYEQKAIASGSSRIEGLKAAISNAKTEFALLSIEDSIKTHQSNGVISQEEFKELTSLIKAKRK